MAKTFTRFILLLSSPLLLTVPTAWAGSSSSPIQTTGNKINFIENKGQVADQYGSTRDDIGFKIAAGKGLNIFIGSGHMHYQWARTAERTELYKDGCAAYRFQH